MILILTLLSRDEEDILRENIEYHLSQGVDYIIATDNASMDGTNEILKEYEKKKVLKYIRENEFYHQSKWVTRMANMAYNEFNADWVINNDADEFWWPNSGNLKSSLEKIPKHYNVVRAKRHNMLSSNETTCEPFYKKMIYRKKISLNPIGKPLPSKVCHKGFSNITVEPGSHRVSGIDGLKIYNSDIEIYHYPARSLKQTLNKVTNIGFGYEKTSQIDQTLGGATSRAIRTIYSEYKKDPKILKKFYNSYQIDFSKIIQGIESGDIVKDIKLSEYLDNLMNK